MNNGKKNKEACTQKPLSFAFHPKATNYSYRQVFWLVRFLTAFPSRLGVTVAKELSKPFIGLTATGIAPVLHGIPF
jgi:hypothetical protein